MSKKSMLLFILFQLTATFAQEQSLKAELLSTQKLDADVFVGFDGMGNLFYIKNNIFYKNNTKKSWQYKNVSLGKITKIDFQNTLRILLFYEKFNTVIILDNQLSEIQTINLSQNEVPIIATATGIASQNRLWIYNSLTQQIGLFNYLKNTYQPITPSFQENMKYYNSDFNTFHWIDSDLNWYSCDVFGKTTSLVRISDFDQTQIITNQEIIYLKNGKLYFNDLKKKIILSIENVDKTFSSFYYKDQILSIFTNQEITNYKITIP